MLTEEATSGNSHTGFKIIVAVLLLLIFSLQAFNAYQAYNLRIAREPVADQVVQLYTDVANAAIDYHSEAYGNPNVTRISEQQLMATETQIRQLQEISKQLAGLAEMMR